MTMATTKTTKVLPVRQPLKREPTHPGEILREDVLPALRMNVSQAARELGVSRQLLHRIHRQRRWRRRQRDPRRLRRDAAMPP